MLNPKYRGKDWKPFEVGLVVTNMRILEVPKTWMPQEVFYYKALAPCCGKEVLISHALFIKRDIAGSTLCADCGQGRGSGIKGREKELRRIGLPYGVELPLWPVPPSIINMPMFICQKAPI